MRLSALIAGEKRNKRHMTRTNRPNACTGMRKETFDSFFPRHLPSLLVRHFSPSSPLFYNRFHFSFQSSCIKKNKKTKRGIIAQVTEERGGDVMVQISDAQSRRSRRQHQPPSHRTQLRRFRRPTSWFCCCRGC